MGISSANDHSLRKLIPVLQHLDLSTLRDCQKLNPEEIGAVAAAKNLVSQSNQPIAPSHLSVLYGAQAVLTLKTHLLTQIDLNVPEGTSPDPEALGAQFLGQLFAERQRVLFFEPFPCHSLEEIHLNSRTLALYALGYGLSLFQWFRLAEETEYQAETLIEEVVSYRALKLLEEFQSQCEEALWNEVKLERVIQELLTAEEVFHDIEDSGQCLDSIIPQALQKGREGHWDEAVSLILGVNDYFHAVRAVGLLTLTLMALSRSFISATVPFDPIRDEDTSQLGRPFVLGN